MRDQLALVDNCQGRQRAEIEQLLSCQPERFDRAERALADHVELAFERLLIGDADARSNEHLPNLGQAAPCDLAARARNYGDGAPSEDLLAFLAHDFLERGFARGALVGVERQENLADSVFAGSRKIEAALERFTLQEFVGNLNQHSGAVAGGRIASAGSPMRQVVEDLQRLGDNIMRTFALDVDDEADSACVVLMGGIV